VSLPPRQYALAAELLARAVEASQPGGSGETAEDIAHDHGRVMGATARRELPARPSAAARRAVFRDVLARLGYQPVDEDGATHLRNCPFHVLADAHRPLVCGMNQAFLQGVLEGLEHRDLEARLDPRQDRCCVVVATAAHASADDRPADQAPSVRGSEGREVPEGNGTAL
jgi:predicted ArsR family transcriptional regulator